MIKKLLKKYSVIWNEIKRLIKEEFNSEPAYNDIYIKTKIKIYNNRVYKTFNIIKYLKIMNICRAYLIILLLDSIEYY